MDFQAERGRPVVLVEAASGPDPWGGNFATGDTMVNIVPFFTGEDDTLENAMSFSGFSSADGICGFGVQIQPFAGSAGDCIGCSFPYTAQIEGMSGGGSLGPFTALGTSDIGLDDDAVFLGIRNTEAFDSVSVSVINITGSIFINDYAVNDITLEYCEPEPPEPDPGLYKTLLSGPDEDSDLEPDLVIEAGGTDPAAYSFELLCVGEDALAILDRVPNAWDAAEDATDELDCVLSSTNGKNDGKIPTDIDCAATGTGKLVVNAMARCSGKKDKCKPKDCGAIYLNEGAQVFDGDGIPSHAEACTAEVKTDPCQADTDGDGDDDNVDACPLDPLNECV